jgi:hypothetical protein
MFTAEQYRAKAIEYSKLVRTANGPNEVREFQRLERSFSELADNAQWMTDIMAWQDGAGDGAGNDTAHARSPSAEHLAAVGRQRMDHFLSGLHANPLR